MLMHKTHLKSNVYHDDYLYIICMNPHVLPFSALVLEHNQEPKWKIIVFSYSPRNKAFIRIILTTTIIIHPVKNRNQLNEAEQERAQKLENCQSSKQCHYLALILKVLVFKSIVVISSFVTFMSFQIILYIIVIFNRHYLLLFIKKPTLTWFSKNLAFRFRCRTLRLSTGKFLIHCVCLFYLLNK